MNERCLPKKKKKLLELGTKAFMNDFIKICLCIFPVAISFEKSPNNSIDIGNTEILLHWESCCFSLRIMKTHPFPAIFVLLFISKKCKIPTLPSRWMSLEMGC